MNISKLIPLYTCDDADIHEPLEIDYALLGYDKSTVHKHLTPPEYLEIESRLSNPDYYPQHETALPFEIGKRHRTKPQIIVTGHLGNRFYIRYFGDRVSILGSMQRLACSNNVELSCGKTQVELWRRFCLEYDIDPTGWIVSRIEFAFQAMIPFNMRDTQRVAESFKNKKFLPIDAKTVDGPSHILAYDDEPTLYSHHRTFSLKWYDKGYEISTKGAKGMLSNDGFNLHRIEKTYRKIPHKAFRAFLGRNLTMLDLDNTEVLSFFFNDFVKAILQFRFNDLAMDDTMPVPRKEAAFHHDRKLVQDALMSPDITAKRELERLTLSGKSRRAKQLAEVSRSNNLKIEQLCYFPKGSLSYCLLKRLYQETSSIAASAWNSRRGKAVLLMLEKGDFKCMEPKNIHLVLPETHSTAA